MTSQADTELSRLAKTKYIRCCLRNGLGEKTGSGWEHDGTSILLYITIQQAYYWTNITTPAFIRNTTYI